MTSRTTSRADNNVGFDPLVDTWQTVRHRAQAAYFRVVLAATEGNVTAAAKLAGVGRTQFYEYRDRLRLMSEDEENS